MSGKYRYDVVDTPFGEAAVVGRAGENRLVVVRILLPDRDRSAAERVEEEFPGVGCSHGAPCGICSQIIDSLQGKEVVFDAADIDAGIVKGFAMLVLTKTAEIPRGRVMTYGGLAAAIGAPRGARAVGNALAGNPFPLFYPCHRVIRGDGTSGGFGGGLRLKRDLLEREGVDFDRRGRVAPEVVLKGE